MTIETTQQLGWVKEATPGTDPINAVNADYWKFGILTNRFDNEHPIETHNWVAEYHGDHRTPNELSLVSTEARADITFYPVNLIPFYMVLATGATHSVASNVHTIDPSEPGTSHETYTIRSESTGGSGQSPTVATKEFHSMTNCKARALNLSFNRLRFYDFMAATLVFTGMETKTPTLNETHTTGTKYPTTDGTMTGTEVKDPFRWDTNALLTWDYGADNIAYQNQLLNFNTQLINYMGEEGIDGQADIEYLTEGAFEFRFGFQIMRGTDTSIMDDFLACTDPPDEHILFKLYSTSTYYLQIEYMDVGVFHCKKNYAKFQGTDRTLPTYDVMGLAEDIQIKGRDGLDPNAAQNKYYGESL